MGHTVSEQGKPAVRRADMMQTQHCCRTVHRVHLANSQYSEQVAGNFHFAPGKSFQQGNMHVHDLVPFPTKKFDMSHHINKLSFGKVRVEDIALVASRCRFCNMLHILNYSARSFVRRVLGAAGISRTQEPSGWHQEEPAVGREP